MRTAQIGAHGLTKVVYAKTDFSRSNLKVYLKSTSQSVATVADPGGGSGGQDLSYQT